MDVDVTPDPEPDELQAILAALGGERPDGGQWPEGGLGPDGGSGPDGSPWWRAGLPGSADRRDAPP